MSARGWRASEWLERRNDSGIEPWGDPYGWENKEAFGMGNEGAIIVIRRRGFGQWTHLLNPFLFLLLMWFQICAFVVWCNW